MSTAKSSKDTGTNKDFSTGFRDNPYTKISDNLTKFRDAFGDSDNNSRDRFELPTFKTQPIDGDKSYRDALKYSDYAADNANRQIANREWQASQQNLSNYKQKSEIDDAQYSRRKEIDKNTSPQSAGSFSSFMDGLTRYDPVISGSAYAPTVEYRPREDYQAAFTKMQNRLEEQNRSNQMQRNITEGEYQRYNQSILNNQQNQANLALTQSQGKTQRDIAAINAQGNLFSSLLGSIGSGSPNYRFWN